jgi:hypothetical protein
LKGRNGSRIDLGIDHTIAILAVLTELLGQEVDPKPTPESECKTWAKTLRENLPKLRLIKGTRNDFLVIQGANLGRMFTGTRYRHYRIDFKPNWGMAKELNPDWKMFINHVIKFLDSCGGIIGVV